MRHRDEAGSSAELPHPPLERAKQLTHENSAGTSTMESPALLSLAFFLQFAHFGISSELSITSMRYPTYVLAAFVVLSCRSTESTPVTSGQTDDSARDLSTDSRLKTRTPVAPALLHLQDSVVDDVDHERRGNEERLGNGWSSSPDAWKILRIDDWIQTQPYLRGVQRYREINKPMAPIASHETPGPWRIKSKTPGHSFSNDAVVKSMLESGQVQELAGLFHRLRHFDGLEGFADKMQRDLLAKRPELLPYMFKLWLTSRVSPTNVYKMMPIGAEKSLMKSAMKTNDLSVLEFAVYQWSAYVRQYQDQGHVYSSMNVLNQLMPYRRFIDRFPRKQV